MIRSAIAPSLSTSITICATTTTSYTQQRQYTHFGPVRRPVFQSRSRGESGDGRGATTPVSVMNDKTSNHTIDNNHTAVSPQQLSFLHYSPPHLSPPTTPPYYIPYPPHTAQPKGVSYPSSHPHQPPTYPFHHRKSTPSSSGHPHYTAARGSTPPPKDGSVKEPPLPAKSSSATTKSTPPTKQQVTSTPPSTNSTGINGQGSSAHRQRTPPTSSPPAFLREGTRAFTSPYLVGLTTFLSRFLPVDRIRKALTKAGVSERVVSAAGRGWFGIAIDILPLLFSFLLIPEGLRRAQAISLRHRIADGHPPIAANAQPPNSPKNAAFPTTKKDDEDDEKRSNK